MLLEWIWVGGQFFCFAALLFGAYLVLIESEPFLTLLGKKSSVPIVLSPEEFRAIRNFNVDDCGCPTCGNGTIDTEHLALLNGVSALRNKILRGGTVDEISVIIDALIRDMRQHFQDEEAVLAAVDYPGLATHASLHQMLIDGAGSELRQFRSGRLGVGDEFQNLVREVYGPHMLEADGEYSPYLQTVH